MMEAAAGAYTRLIFPEIRSTARPHLTDLQKTMLNATPDCIKLLSADGLLLTMNRAGCAALGVPEDSGFGMPWLPLLSEDVHAVGGAALRQAAGGQSARFPGRSESPDGIVYWDNLLTPIVDANGEVLSILCVSRDVTEKTRLERQLEEAISREKMLSGELQHRVKNLFSIVSGLAHIAGKEAGEAASPEAGLSILQEKLAALSRASNLAFTASSNAGLVDLELLMAAVLEPYRGRYSAAGERTAICRDNVTNLALYLHELATNSVKYGALGADAGRVTVRWSQQEDTIELVWTERGGPPLAGPASRHGFGSKLVDRIVRSTGGSLDRVWQPEGLVAHLRMPASLHLKPSRRGADSDGQPVVGNDRSSRPAA